MAGADIEMDIIAVEDEDGNPPYNTPPPRAVTLSLPLDPDGVLMDLQQHMIGVLGELAGNRVRGMRLTTIHLDFNFASLYAELIPQRYTNLRVLFEGETTVEAANRNREKIYLLINVTLALVGCGIMLGYMLYLHLHCNFNQ